MSTTISINNASKRAPKWLRKLTRVVNIALIPVAVTTLKGLWHGSEAHLNEVLLIVTVTLPGSLELLKIVTTDDGEDDQQNQSA